jgi:hypothetical protein
MRGRIDSLTTVDIVDREGSLVTRILMSPAQRVMGFGADRIYVANSDTDGLAFLSRHRWTGLRQ